MVDKRKLNHMISGLITLLTLPRLALALSKSGGASPPTEQTKHRDLSPPRLSPLSLNLPRREAECRELGGADPARPPP
jgi:hypothetical protein